MIINGLVLKVKTNEECFEQNGSISAIVSILEHNSIIVK